MAEEKRKVAIDADFFLKLTEKQNSGELFIKIIDEMNVLPVMHQYVYEDELYLNSVAHDLVDQGIMQVVQYKDFLQDTEKLRYEDNFRNAYQYFNMKAMTDNVYSYKKKGESLGEIRTALMAVYMGIDLFMSDDGGAKMFVKSRLHSDRHPLAVYSVYDTLLCIAQKADKKLLWKDVKGCAKAVFKNRKILYHNLNEVWHRNNCEI